jgi:hypothetical protein
VVDRWCEQASNQRVTEHLRQRIRERIAAEYRGALRAGREHTETAIIGWCAAFLIAGSLVVVLFAPTAGHWMCDRHCRRPVDSDARLHASVEGVVEEARQRVTCNAEGTSV